MLNKSYILYTLLSFFIGLNLLIFFTLRYFDNYLSEKKRELGRLTEKVNTIKGNINNILHLKEKLSIRYIEEDEAESIILKKLENIKKIYGGKIIEGPVIKKGVIEAKISFNLKPENSKKFIKTLVSLEDSIYPVVNIEKLFITNSKNGTTVNIELNLTQPFYGGR